jgi:hypothetical protein
VTITTTLNEIRRHGPLQDGWEKLLTHLGKTKADDEPHLEAEGGDASQTQ